MVDELRRARPEIVFLDALAATVGEIDRMQSIRPLTTDAFLARLRSRLGFGITLAEQSDLFGMEVQHRLISFERAVEGYQQGIP